VTLVKPDVEMIEGAEKDDDMRWQNNFLSRAVKACLMPQASNDIQLVKLNFKYHST
jgi:hypothetical protein